MRYHERMVMLSVIDGLWKDHLLSMDHLKEGIGLRGYAQQDPLVAYKRESFDMFEAMMLKFQEDTVRFLFRMQILGPDGQPVNAAPEPRRAVPPAPPGGQRRSAMPRQWPARCERRPARFRFPTRAALDDDRCAGEGVPAQEAARTCGGQPRRQRRTEASRTQRRTGEKVGRNDPCPCGCGKKYKKCHGAEA